jgi:CheY-like chemotaxis protein
MANDGKCSIVLVEDLSDYRQILKSLFELDGHTVSSAADGASGLELIRRVKPDVAFIDIGLPALDGFELARKLRTEGSRTYLVALTAYGGDRNRQKAIESGFDRHILKPLLPDERAEVLRLANERCD